MLFGAGLIIGLYFLLLWSLIPAAFWYMLPVLLIVAIYLAAVYAKQIICCIQSRFVKK